MNTILYFQGVSIRETDVVQDHWSHLGRVSAYGTGLSVEADMRYEFWFSRSYVITEMIWEDGTAILPQRQGEHTIPNPLPRKPRGGDCGSGSGVGDGCEGDDDIGTGYSEDEGEMYQMGRHEYFVEDGTGNGDGFDALPRRGIEQYELISGRGPTRWQPNENMLLWAKR